MGVTATLVEQMLGARLEEIPPAAIASVRNALLDDVGVALLGSTMDAQPIIAWAKDTGGGVPDAVLVGDGARVSVAAAAGAGAQFAGSTNFNEAGPGQHIFSALAQTALAVGQRTGADGGEVLATLAAAYQINGQLHLALRPAALDQGSGMRHIPMTIALVAGRLLGLDATALNRAVSLALYMVPLPTAERVFWHESWKRRGMFHIALCTQGIGCALLAHHGFDGPQDVVELDERYDAERIGDSPEPYYYPQHMLQLKLWQTSRGVHAGVQALLGLVGEHAIDVAQIERISFRGPRIYTGHPFTDPAPSDVWAGIHSVPWALAMALLDTPMGHWYEPERYADPRARALAARITVEEDAAADAATVEHTVTAGRQAVTDTANEVVVELADGSVHARRTTKSEAIGHPHNPLSAEQLAAKFRVCATPVLGETRAEELLGRLGRIEAEPDVRALAPLLGPER